MRIPKQDRIEKSEVKLAPVTNNGVLIYFDHSVPKEVKDVFHKKSCHFQIDFESAFALFLNAREVFKQLMDKAFS